MVKPNSSPMSQVISIRQQKSTFTGRFKVIVLTSSLKRCYSHCSCTSPKSFMSIVDSPRTDPSGTPCLIQKEDGKYQRFEQAIACQSNNYGNRETRFPRRWYWGFKSSRLWSWVAKSFIPEISKEHTENVNGFCLRNVGNQQPHYSVVPTPQTWTLNYEITSYYHQEDQTTLDVWKWMV
jgi:hypothetical protein